MKEITQVKAGDLRVWWICQVGAPIPVFRVPVKSIREAKLLLNTLANYDIYQFKNHVKPDYSNTGGLERFEDADGEGKLSWAEWYNDDGEDIDHVDDEGNSLDE